MTELRVLGKGVAGTTVDRTEQIDLGNKSGWEVERLLVDGVRVQSILDFQDPCRIVCQVYNAPKLKLFRVGLN